MAAALLVMLSAACTAQVSSRTVSYPDGTPRWVVDTVQSIPHGVSTTYHRNGRVASTGRYVNGLKHGVFEHHDEQGKFVRHEAYVEGSLVWESSDPDEPLPSSLSFPRPGHPDVPEIGPMQSAFATLDRAQASSAVEAQLTLERFADGMRGQLVHLYGQHLPDRWGGYVQLSGGRLDAFDVNPSRYSKMVAEVGALWHRRSSGSTLLLRAGAFAPLAADDVEGFRAAARLSYGRLTDAAMTFPRTIGGRGSTTLSGTYGMYVYRLDVGIDAVVDIGDGDHHSRMHDKAALLGRINAAGGIQLRDLAVSFELVSVGLLRGPESGFDRFAHSLASALHLRRRRVTPRLALIIPVDAHARGEVVAFLFGVELSKHRKE